MKIAFIGKFTKLHDEEYIARSFEKIGHKVIRIPQYSQSRDIGEVLLNNSPDILLYCKWECPKELYPVISQLKSKGMKTVCWLFDLYYGYTRENQVRIKSFFKSDYVFTTDGGHNHRFTNDGIKHFCVRQGIYDDECKLFPIEELKNDIVFVGSENPVYPERSKLVLELGAKWVGRKNTDEIRGLQLNELYAESKIVIGDSFYSPRYWSNRIVETLGRGGFLIHQEVEGLKEEYPDLVTYERGNTQDLKNKIAYYLKHEDERLEIIKKNYELVKSRYTMDKKCRQLLDYVETY